MDGEANTIGARIAQARKETGGMTQVELAALLGVSERSVQAYENDEVVPYRQMQDLERILSKPMAWFLHGDASVVARDQQIEAVMAELKVQRQLLEELVALTRGRT